jgi:hypothetical protein
MPNLAQDFATSAIGAMDFARGIESARARLAVAEARRYLPLAQLELAYELAFLRMFTAWEDFIEQSLLRYMCGYAARHGQEQPVGGRYCSTLSAAKAALYGNQQYLLGHNPGKIIARVAQHLRQSRHEIVIASIHGRMEHFAAIRHRIAHAQASTDFDTATMALAGKRYRGSRPGRFLRDWAPHAPAPSRWIDMIAVEFKGLAFQIVPL